MSTQRTCHSYDIPMPFPLRQSFLPFLALACATVASPVRAEVDILGCSIKENQAVAPTDALNCQWKNGLLDATLVQLYGDGWRLIDTAFYDGDRQVLYLERHRKAAAADDAPEKAP